MAAGLALAVAAVATPFVVRQLRSPARPARPATITVDRLGPRAVNGVIAAGTINGKPWQVRLTKARARTCWSSPSSGWMPNGDCLETVGDYLKHPPGLTDPVTIWTFWPAIFGPVQSDVARVSMRLSDGVVLNLRPVEAFGRRWIGIVLPSRPTPVKVVAYTRQAEIARSVPFVGYLAGEPDIEFLTWLPPGDDGPSRATKVISGADMTLVLHVGPWGNVLTSFDGRMSFPLDYRPSGALAGGGGLPRTVPMVFPWPARYMKLVMSDGTTRRVPLVLGAGLGFAIIRATRSPAIVSWGVYDSGGHRLSGGEGAPGK
jgi:hypothetical protein